MMDVTVYFPETEEGVKNANMEFWHVQAGDEVEAGQVLGEASTGKAEVQIEAPAAGTVKEILVEEGGVVRERQPLAVISTP